ncbi:MAG: hypothetical protein AB1571_00500 [Nanoarchaeota archaeon]
MKKLRFYKCKICGNMYKEQNIAKKCGDFCRKNNACSTEIAKYAINRR